jgi:RNA recognition motif-containing protein
VNIYVGNLPYTATAEDLRQAFEEFGTVTSSSVVMDKMTGRSRGFGFVEMETDAEGARAIEEMNGKDWMGRTLSVNEARPRERSFSGGGGGGRPYGGGGGGGRSDGGGGRGYEPSRSFAGGGDNRGGGGGGDRFGGGGGRDRRGGGGSGPDRGRGRAGDDRGGRGRGGDERRWESGEDDDY